MIRKSSVRFVLLSITLSFSLLWDGQPIHLGGGLVSEAEARIGRPATPMSYAGVARRTTRRTVRRSVAVGAAAATTARCVQVVNAYGQVFTKCTR